MYDGGRLIAGHMPSVLANQVIGTPIYNPTLTSQTAQLIHSNDPAWQGSYAQHVTQAAPTAIREIGLIFRDTATVVFTSDGQLHSQTAQTILSQPTSEDAWWTAANISADMLTFGVRPITQHIVDWAFHDGDASQAAASATIAFGSIYLFATMGRPVRPPVSQSTQSVTTISAPMAVESALVPTVAVETGSVGGVLPTVVEVVGGRPLFQSTMPTATFLAGEAGPSISLSAVSGNKGITVIGPLASTAETAMPLPMPTSGSIPIGSITPRSRPLIAMSAAIASPSRPEDNPEVERIP